MAISLSRVEYFFALHGAGIKSALDIGCQNLQHFTPERVAELVRSRGREPDPEWLARLPETPPADVYLGDLLAAAGVDYLAYDIFEGPRTRLFDLNRQSADRQFDLVMNFGTTEHVLNQWNAMKVIHDSCKPGGLMWHDLPMQGYFDHGYFNYNPLLFMHLAAANGYELVQMMIGAHPGPSMRDGLFPRYPVSWMTVEAPGGWDQIPVPTGGLLVVLRRTTDAPFRASLHTDDGHPAADVVREAYAAAG